MSISRLGDYRIISYPTDRYNALVQELHSLLSCYTRATNDDRDIIWAILDKYRIEAQDETPERLW